MSLTIDDSKKTTSPLRWDTPIASLIRDDFVLADDYATMNTTLEDALSHRSGLPGHMVAIMGAYPDETLRDAVRKLRHLPLAYPPRTKFDYCNHMFMVVSHALEQITGEPLGEILKRRIWDPLNMHDTYFSVQDVKKCPATSPRLVQGYTWVPEKASYGAEPHMNYAPTTGTGAIVSTVLDYAKWLRAMIYQAGPISSEGYAALVHPRAIMFNDDDPDIVAPPTPYHLYALGWFVETYQGQQFYWHSGSWLGFGVMVGFIPGLHFGFAMMGNTQKARNAQLELYLYLIDTLLGVSGIERAHFVARMTERMNEITKTNSESVAEATKRLFPSLFANRLPHSLPLDGYVGTYSHPGYGVVALKVKDGHLYSDRRNRVQAMIIHLEHAGGEFFVAKRCTPTSSDYLKAEFYIDSTGAARRLGMELEPALGGEKIWFERNL
jgi:CubicO group peptidase (beta-lactamase class C family)